MSVSRTLLAVGLLGTLAIAGCQSDSTPSTTSSTTTTTESQAPAAVSSDGAPPASTDAAAPGQPAVGGPGGPGPGGPGNRGGGGIKRLAEELDLTADQQAKIEAIRQKHMQDQDRQAAMQEIMGVLTPEQQAKLKSRMLGRGRRRHRPGGNGPEEAGSPGGSVASGSPADDASGSPGN